ncbi:venom serine carboxypeptidase-like [Planococcus citri]|uniref:venom serine carboxypeptidase-like n=1 Tax=Planococcus citri TaxID=170843 RepID=UPI0031FA36A1
MCKLLVVFFVLFFQKSVTCDDTFYNDYLDYYQSDLDELIHSFNEKMDYSYDESSSYMDKLRYRLVNDVESGNFTASSNLSETNTSGTEQGVKCDQSDPRINQPIVDDKESIILNSCYPEKSKESAFVSGERNRFKTYSGFFSIRVDNESITISNHFWLFISESNCSLEVPLIVFLHASPHTSLLGHFLLQENSTLQLVKYNFLFVEYKTLFGFSFASSTNETNHPKLIDKARHVQIMLQDFLIIFPEFRKVDVYLAGSYEAGKLAELMLFVLNTDEPNSTKIPNLKGAIITHGALDIDLIINYSPIWSQNGIIDLHTARFMDAHETLGRAVLKSGDDQQLEYFVLNFLHNKVSEIQYATKQEQLVSELMENTTLKLFNNDEFKTSQNIGDRSYEKKVSFFEHTSIQECYLNFAQLFGKYKVLYCNGQLDNIYTHSMTTEYLKQMEWPCNDKWYHAPRKLWYKGERLVGYWKKYSNLHQVLIRNTGYSVDLTRPKLYLRMIELFVEDQTSSYDCL